MRSKIIKLIIIFTITFFGCAEPSKSPNLVISNRELKEAGYEKVALHIRSEQGLVPIILSLDKRW